MAEADGGAQLVSLLLPRNQLILAPRLRPLVDGFSRGDNTATLGNAETGQAWIIPTSGAVFGVASGQAYLVTSSGAGDQRAIADSGQANVRVSAKITRDTGSNTGLICRANPTAGTRIYAWISSAGNVVLGKAVPAFTSLGSTAVTWNAGDLLEIRCQGAAITVFQNATSLLSVTEPDLMGQTSCGIFVTHSATAGTARWDNFLVVPV